MSESISDSNLLALFEGEFRKYREEAWAVEWRRRYTEHVQTVRQTDLENWIRPSFQQTLWESTAVSHIGPGNSVTVTQAYEDEKLARMLFEARNQPRPLDFQDRGLRLVAGSAGLLPYLLPFLLELADGQPFQFSNLPGDFCVLVYGNHWHPFSGAYTLLSALCENWLP